MNVDAEATDRIARQTLAHYARRCWWVSRDDLAQIIATTVLVAHSTYRPDKGPWENYLRRSLRLRLGDELLAMSSPVSARSGHRTPLRGHSAVELSEGNGGAYRSTPEDLVSAAELREHVRALVLRSGFAPQIASLILQELSYQDAREELNVSTQSLASTVRSAISSLKRAPLVRSLLEQ